MAKIALWVFLSTIGVIMNILVMFLIVNIGISVQHISFTDILFLIWGVIGAFSSIGNVILVIYWYEKASYNQEFVDIALKVLNSDEE